MLPFISPEETFRRLQAEEIRLVDIRDVPEFAEVSIAGSLLAPLPVVDRQPLQEAGSAEKPLVFTCRTGRRTKAASPQLESLPGAAFQMKGGIAAWEQAGLPVSRASALPISMMRQIQICAGAMVLVGTIGGMSWSPLLWLSAFVGAGLFFAGVSGFCGLALVLAKMPWNQPR